MTVYRIGKNKIKISLSDGEVRSFFGEYENIVSLSGNAKLIIGMLLEENLENFGFDDEEELLVEIKAKENLGCVIIISPADKEHSSINISKVLFDFPDSESLISGITRLYKVNRRTESDLYKMPKVYRLIINGVKDTNYFFMNEYCSYKSNSPLELAYTEEHGTLLVKKNAIEAMGHAFSKGS